MQNTLIDNSTGNLSMTSILRRCIAAEGLNEVKSYEVDEDFFNSLLEQ